MKIIFRTYLFLLLLLVPQAASNSQLKQGNSHANQVKPICGYDINCLFSEFLQRFERTNKELILAYGQPDQVEYDSTSLTESIVATHTFSNFSVRTSRLKSRSSVYLNEVSIWDSTTMAIYGFIKGMTRRTLEKLIRMKPQIFNEQGNDLELAYFPDNKAYYFRFMISDGKLYALLLSEYTDR